ncbi:MAG: hypothetical protein GF333_01110 [Candidatus Omnitrophica bacterium]|nr:hypothetical protein [Candidatus Omnitrophota bacterium]
MNTRRSIGVTVMGVLLSVAGGVIFFQAVFMIYLWIVNKPVLLHWLQGASAHLSPRQLSLIVGFFEKEFANPWSLSVVFVLLPFMAFLTFWGGINILRLKEDWRKITLGAVITGGICKVITSVSMLGNMVAVIVAGVAVENSGVSGSISTVIGNVFQIYEMMIIREIVLLSAVVGAVVFFFTRSEVREQFE